MKKSNIFLFVLLGIIIVLTGGSNCSGDEKEIIYDSGVFPEEVSLIPRINSSYDDYNVAYYQIGGELLMMFSSNRSSTGGEFDFVSASAFFLFDKTNGDFTLSGEMINRPDFNAIKDEVNNTNNQLGPYLYFNSNNGLIYFFYAEDSPGGPLDIKVLSYAPTLLNEAPSLNPAFDATVINSGSNDAYLCIDWDYKNLYFTSDRGGDYDIYETAIGQPSSFDGWLEGDPQTVVATDSINSSSDDKCPYITGDIMVFTSDRPGGLGGFDLYYSLFLNDKWNTPVNFGPAVNTEYNEYRPILGIMAGFTNYLMVFSSDRPEGEGGYDLYFTGMSFE